VSVTIFFPTPTQFDCSEYLASRSKKYFPSTRLERCQIVPIMCAAVLAVRLPAPSVGDGKK
jgi:hypothetical protein